MRSQLEERSETGKPIASALATWGSRAAALTARYEVWWILAVAVVWLLVRSWYALSPLWFDELFTFYMARLPHLHELFRALAADGGAARSFR